MFYSNCFVQAIKHKLRHPFKVNLTYISPKYSESWCPHWMWSDGVNDYDFGVEKRLKWHQVFLFKGEIRAREAGWNKRYKQTMIDRYNRKQE